MMTTRAFNVIDDFNREGLAIDVDLSMPSQRVIRSLEQVIEWHGKPAAIRCDNGPELLSGPLIARSKKHQITMLTFSPASQHKMLMLSDLIEQHVMSGWI